MLKELQYAQKWLADGHPIVLAVVAQTWGSAPRPKGSLMVIHEDGHFEGSVSGGCVEGSVIGEASVLMGTHTSKTLDFTVASEDAWQIGLACGGQIQIQLFPLGKNDAAPIKSALEYLGNRRAGELVLSKTKFGTSFSTDSKPENSQVPLVETEQDLTLIIWPLPVLCIVGAVHIAQALTSMAVACGYDTTIIDPRGIFVEERNFSGATIVHDWPDEFLQTHRLDASSALVTLTHDPKIDDAALLAGLGSDAFYIGSLGSKKTHAARIERLLEQGVAADQLERIHGPIGLNIGSKSPAEIAVSIMAQITAARRGIHAV